MPTARGIPPLQAWEEVKLTVAFGLLAVGYPLFWVAFPIGFGGGMPLTIGLARWYGSRQEQAREDSRPGRDRDEEALARLRERYARGDLTEAEFERRVSRLLETESVADAREFLDRGRTDPHAGSEAGTEADESQQA